MSSRATIRRSEWRATARAITSMDGRHPSGKMCLRMKVRDAFSTS